MPLSGHECFGDRGTYTIPGPALQAGQTCADLGFFLQAPPRDLEAPPESLNCIGVPDHVDHIMQAGHGSHHRTRPAAMLSRRRRTSEWSCSESIIKSVAEQVATGACDPRDFCTDVHGLRDSLNASLQNCAVVAAFMTALAGAIYVTLPEPTKCMSGEAIAVEMALSWVSMGCFVFTIMASVLLLSDLDGLPDEYLPRHIRSIHYFHALPLVFILVGICCMGMSYGIDIAARGAMLAGKTAKVFGAERRKATAMGGANPTSPAADPADGDDSQTFHPGECTFVNIGLIAAPMFLVACPLLALALRYYRVRTNHQYQDVMQIGKSLLMPWYDRFLPCKHPSLAV